MRENGFVPLRLIDTNRNRETTAVWMYTQVRGLGVLRLDLHPAWSRDCRKICFNGAPTNDVKSLSPTSVTWWKPFVSEVFWSRLSLKNEEP
jgi:hypothetical protein